MRVEHIGTPKSINESTQRQGLSQGDILIAEVTDIKGDQVYLKNQDGGALLTAKLLSDIAVSVGDYVETVVDEAGGGRYVLRVIDISHQMPFGSEADAGLEMLTARSQSARAQALLNTLAMLKSNPGADPKAAAFLSRHGIAGTAQNIETLSQMAKGISPVTALLAEVIQSFGPKRNSVGSMAQTATPMANTNTRSAMQTAQTAANIDAMAQNTISTEGQTHQTSDAVVPQAAQQNQSGISSQTQENTSIRMDQGQMNAADGSQASAENRTIAQPAAQKNNQAAGQGAVQTPSASTQSADKATPHTQAAQAMPETAQQIQNTGDPAQPASQTIIHDASQTAQPAAASANTAGKSVGDARPSVPDAAEKTDSMQVPAKPGAPIDAAQSVKTTAGKTEGAEIPAQQNDAAIPKEVTSEQIAGKARTMFVNLNDADKLAVHLKKAVQELPKQLKELKLLIEHTDNIVKDTVAPKFDQIEKQMSMLNDVKRFDCYQIPLQTGPQQQTAAELYVYRYRGSKKTVDPENILILLGLDTQYMGRVETLIKTSGKSLGIEFNLEDMRLSEEMKADAVYLEQAAEDAGYHLAGVSVKELAVRTTVLNAQDRLEKETGGTAGNVDVRI